MIFIFELSDAWLKNQESKDKIKIKSQVNGQRRMFLEKSKKNISYPPMITTITSITLLTVYASTCIFLLVSEFGGIQGIQGISAMTCLIELLYGSICPAICIASNHSIWQNIKRRKPWTDKIYQFVSRNRRVQPLNINSHHSLIKTKCTCYHTIKT